MAYHNKHLRSYESFSQEDDFFSILDQSPSLDYNNSFVNPLKDIQTHETWFSSSQESINAYPISSTYDDDDHMFLASFHDLQAISTLSQDLLNESWNDIFSICNNNDQVQPKSNEISRANSNMEIVLYQEEEDTTRISKKRRYIRDQDHGGVLTLTNKETLKQYYNMPIAKVAKELNIGLTPLKKRCRELGVHRWPHRKLNSLQSLIDNLKEELGKMEEGDVNKDKLMEVLEILEMEKKVIEENPNLEFGDKNKRLRQAYFKETFKRRRLLSLISSTSTSSSVSSCEQENL